MREHTLARDVEGRVVWRGEPAYEDVRQNMLWNALKPARYPDVIVGAATETDVQAAVSLARSRGLRVAVRTGGHSWCGSPLRDGGMLIDLSALRGYAIDPATGDGTPTASVQPAVTGRELASRLAQHGLAFPTGHCGSVPVAGYLLSGGLGWNAPARGPACAGVREIEAVTADGEVVRANETENPDLLWAARGAGPGLFAVVTRFRLRLYPLPAAIATTSLVFATTDAVEVARGVEAVAGDLPPNVELTIVLTRTVPGLTAEGATNPVVNVTATVFAGTREEATEAVEPLLAAPFVRRSLARSIDQSSIDQSSIDRPADFGSLYDYSDVLWPPGHRYAADTLWSDAGLGALIPTLAADVARAPSRKSLILVPVPAVGPVAAPPPGMAFSALGRNYSAMFGIWEDAADDDGNIRWLRDTMNGLEPLGTGHYVAEADLTAESSRARRSYRPEAWERLQALRVRWDPTSVFQPYLGP
jgi:FAD/FMN-containing dehydrogenase